MPRKRSGEGALGAEDAAAIAASLRAKRIRPSTKKAYDSKMNEILAYVKTNFPGVFMDDQPQIPLPKAAILSFFGNLVKGAHDCDMMDSSVDNQIMSLSHVESFRSALVNFYRNKSIELQPDVNAELNSFLQGYAKTINQLKQRSLIKVAEGKRHLKSNGYSLIANKLMTQVPSLKGQSWSGIIFSWSFFVIMWNLMSRSDSIDKIMLQHIELCEDALVIEEQGHKGDQTGESKYGIHMYANPYQPALCPVLALAVLLFGYPERRNGLFQLFIGPDNKSRFGRSLRQVLSKLSDYELQVLGCPIGDIGTHSLRKGSSTFALGQVNGPNPVSVFLRMGQSLGQLKDRYIHVGEGADQLCGRMVAGLPFDSEEFGVLPPHFPPSLSGEMNQQYWNQIVCGYDQYPAGAKTIFPFLLASLLHHEDYLRTNLNENHPIFVARVFTNNRLLHRLRGQTILAIAASPIANLKATGIPPHLAIAGKIKKLIETLGLMETRICSLESSLKIESEKLLRSIKDDVPILVAQEIRKSLVVEGAVPFCLRDMDGLRSELFACIDARLTDFTNCQYPVQTATSELNEPVNLEWKAWCWNDGLIAHCVPENWEFPVLLTVKSMWNLWFYGNKTSGIRPYRCITKRDLNHQYHMRHTRTSIVMKSLIDIAVERALISVGPKRAAKAISDMSIAMSDELFEAAYSVLIHRLYPSSNPSREEHLTCGTIYNRLVKFKRSTQHHS